MLCASYSSKEAAARWFAEWNSVGKVLEWNIKQSYFDPEKAVLTATWEFCYDYPDIGIQRFDGVTVMTVEDNRIKSLHEYESKHERFYPYG